MTAAQVAVPVAAVCTGLAGGVYLAFSAMVLPALRTAPPAHALALMQRINTTAVRPAFMTVFFGAALSSAAVLALPAFTGAARSPAVTAGALLSLASFAITVTFHVPRNRALAALDPHSATAASRGGTLLAQWRRGNHLRAAAAGAGLLAFLL